MENALGSLFLEVGGRLTGMVLLKRELPNSRGGNRLISACALEMLLPPRSSLTGNGLRKLQQKYGS